MAAVPFIAAIVSLIFAGILARDWARRRRPYQLLWSIALLCYTVAAFGEYSSLAYGWSAGSYRAYFFCAMTLVALMGCGELYLLLGPRSWTARISTIVTGILAVVFLVQLSTSPLNLTALHQGTVTIGGAGVTAFIRNFYGILFSAVGGMILIIGSLVSGWKQRSWTPLLIAAGGVVLSAAGSIARMGSPVFLPASELIGICLLFAGFLLAVPRKTARPARALEG